MKMSQTVEPLLLENIWYQNCKDITSYSFKHKFYLPQSWFTYKVKNFSFKFGKNKLVD